MLVSLSPEMCMKMFFHYFKGMTVSVCGAEFSFTSVDTTYSVFSTACRTTEVSRKKKQGEKKQTGSKILVRNVPFQATVREIRELFW